MQTSVAAENKATLKELAYKRSSLNSLFKEVLGTPKGKECLREILRISGFFEPNVEKTTELMLIKEGQRRLAIGIASYVYGRDKAAALLKMLEENKE